MTFTPDVGVLWSYQLYTSIIATERLPSLVAPFVLLVSLLSVRCLCSTMLVDDIVTVSAADSSNSSRVVIAWGRYRPPADRLASSRL